MEMRLAIVLAIHFPLSSYRVTHRRLPIPPPPVVFHPRNYVKSEMGGDERCVNRYDRAQLMRRRDDNQPDT